ncbi:BlaI/MecI/CopY family transcriptional regulator [Eisenibacter elegans]|uniref:BlaI/MecI/CopY family transcriptional regulator n=1 Tax=Eisenibacter elegans TaxID=997 RepID=UPI00041D7EDA|nr:BlaI/MecI/CopY family transcriptional regulator [Eisenibacter elegans]
MAQIPKPTEAELEILQELWRRQEATVRQVHEALNAKRNDEVGYTTTLKLMQIMVEKGLLSRNESQRSHLYRPLIKQEDLQATMLNKLVEGLFGGSAMNLVMQALGNKKTSKAELDEIRKLLDELEQKGGAQ